VPTLTVDETNLAPNATPRSGCHITPGSDACAAGMVAYTLSTVGGDSGLTDVATGQPVILVKNGNVIEGKSEERRVGKEFRARW